MADMCDIRYGFPQQNYVFFSRWIESLLSNGLTRVGRFQWEQVEGSEKLRGVEFLMLL